MSKRPVKAPNIVKGEITGVVFIAAALFLLASLWGLRLGAFGETLDKVLHYAFGWGAILPTLLFLWVGVRYIWRTSENVFTVKVFAIVLLSINILALFHHIVVPINAELLPAHLLDGGGLLGGAIVFAARKIFGIDGTLIFLLTTCLCLAIFAFTWSLKKTVQNAGKTIGQGSSEASAMIAGAGEKLKKSTIFNYEKILPSDNSQIQDDVIEEPASNRLVISPAPVIKDVVVPFEPVVQQTPVVEVKKETCNVRQTEQTDTIPVLTKKALIPPEPPVILPKKPATLPPVKETAPDGYRYPYPALLTILPDNVKNTGADEAMIQAGILEQTLADFKVSAKIVDIVHGPAVTRFEIEPAPGVKVNRIASLVDDLTLKLAAPGIRIENSIPGKSAMGVEVPKKKVSPVVFYDVVTAKAFEEQESPITVALGKDIAGETIVADIGKMPHLLVAGSTGSGKSVCINTIINSILFKASPEQVKFIMVDPKVVELSTYNGIPHLLTPVVTNPKKAAAALFWAVEEMEKRYRLFADSGVREISRYNKTALEKIPYIIIIIDELADLMMVAPGDVEDAICRLAQKARAAGLHLILATQRPSVDVITGIIKANIPSRIAFAVSSQIDSRTILDMGGAEKLLGKGDMLYYPSGMSKPLRVQGAFISDEDIETVTDYIKQQALPVEYSDAVTAHELPGDKTGKSNNEEPLLVEQDELLLSAMDVIMQTGQASASMLQRRMRIGYTRAARLIDSLEDSGVIGAATGTSKPRDILLSYDEARKRVEAEN